MGNLNELYKFVIFGFSIYVIITNNKKPYSSIILYQLYIFSKVLYRCNPFIFIIKHNECIN